MKSGAAEIIGKTVIGVIIKQAKKANSVPQSQLYLIFDDNSHYEFYSHTGHISNTGGCWPRSSFREVYNYMEDQFDITFHAVKDPDSDEVSYHSSGI